MVRGRYKISHIIKIPHVFQIIPNSLIRCHISSCVYTAPRQELPDIGSFGCFPVTKYQLQGLARQANLGCVFMHESLAGNSELRCKTPGGPINVQMPSAEVYGNPLSSTKKVRSPINKRFCLHMPWSYKQKHTLPTKIQDLRSLAGLEIYAASINRWRMLRSPICGKSNPGLALHAPTWGSTTS